MPADDEPHPLSALIWENVQALMVANYGESNITRLGRDTGIAQGGAQRLQQQRKVGPPLLAKVAAYFGVEPWQLLAPKLGADLYRMDQERRMVCIYPHKIPGGGNVLGISTPQRGPTRQTSSPLSNPPADSSRRKKP